jgi:hypothetical protein
MRDVVGETAEAGVSVVRKVDIFLNFINGLELINGLSLIVGANFDGIESLVNLGSSGVRNGFNGMGIGGKIVLVLTRLGGIGGEGLVDDDGSSG